MWFYDRLQTVQCVSSKEENLGWKDFEILAEYCNNNNKTCLVPCEYTKRGRMFGLVHDECACSKEVNGEPYLAHRRINCSNKEDKFKAKCKNDTNGRDALVFCIDNTTVSEEFFGTSCAHFGIDSCEVSCDFASNFDGPRKKVLDAKDCYCYNSDGGKILGKNNLCFWTTIGISIFIAYSLPLW